MKKIAQFHEPDKPNSKHLVLAVDVSWLFRSNHATCYRAKYATFHLQISSGERFKITKETKPEKSR